MAYLGKKPADIIATSVDTTTGTFSGDLTVDTNTLYVDSANNKVGIGTSSPSQQLEITTASSALIRVNGSTASVAGIDFGDSVDQDIGRIRYDNSVDVMQFWANNAERMRIDSSGNVGIGTTNAFAKLVVEGNNNSNVAVVNAIGTSPNYIFDVRDDGTSKFRVDGYGSVGIGTTPNSGMTALTALQIGYGGGFQSHASSTNSIYVLSNAYYDGSWKYKNAGSATEYKAINGEHIWETASSGSANGAITWSEAMRIDSSNNLLVGTSTVNANNAISLVPDGQSKFYTGGQTVLNIHRGNNDGDIVDFYRTTTKVGSISSNGGSILIGSSDVGIYFDSGSDRILPVNVSTNSVRNDAIDIGGNPHRFKDLYLSGGVYLGGTGSANKLDDYEEGNWTPTLAQYAGTPTIGNANYTKVGRLVHASATINLDGTSDASSFVIQGLPFTSLATASNVFGGYVSYSTTTFADNIFVLVGANTSTVYLYKTGGTSFLYNDLGASKVIRFVAIYFST